MTSLSSLAADYRSSWSGRCRGRARTAYIIENDELIFRKDFLRWVDRQFIKGGKMIFRNQIESDHLVIMVFRKDEMNLSPVRQVANAILKLGGDPAGMPSSAINWAVQGHPHSGGQRFREICAAYRRQWPGITDYDYQYYAKTGMFPCHIYLISHTIKKNRFHFTASFMSWLRANIDNIESVVYPVTVRRVREK
jgi:hypothetical protein